MGCPAQSLRIRFRRRVLGSMPQWDASPAIYTKSIFCQTTSNHLLRTHVEVADQDVISPKVICDDKSRTRGICNPMQHTNSVLHHGSQVGLEVNRYHAVV